jgi:hypothetical protein
MISGIVSDISSIIGIVPNTVSKLVDRIKFGAKPIFGFEHKVYKANDMLYPVLIKLSNLTDRNLSNIEVTCNGNHIKTVKTLLKGCDFEITVGTIRLSLLGKLELMDIKVMDKYNGEKLEFIVKVGLVKRKYSLDLQEILENLADGNEPLHYADGYEEIGLLH